MYCCENSKIQKLSWTFCDDPKIFPFVKNHFGSTEQKGRKSFRNFPYSWKIPFVKNPFGNTEKEDENLLLIRGKFVRECINFLRRSKTRNLPNFEKVAMFRLAIFWCRSTLTGTMRPCSKRGGESWAPSTSTSPTTNSYPGTSDSKEYTEPVLLNVYGAPELMPRNEFRQPM